MNDTTIGADASLLLHLAKETVQDLSNPSQLLEGGERERHLAAEVAELFEDRERARELLLTLFPDGVPADLRFYSRLNDLRGRLRWRDVSHRVAGLLWSTALQSLTADSSEALLRAFLAVDTHQFFVGLSSLAVPLKEIELRAEFAFDWLGQVVRRIGNDLASGGFWEALSTYCEAHVRSAFDVLSVLLLSQLDDSTIAVGAFMLGVVRTLPKDAAASAEFSHIEATLATHDDAKKRSAYYRSWIRTAWRGKLTAGDLLELIKRLENGAPNEIEEAFAVVCSSLLSPSLDADCMRAGLAWLHAKASPIISPIAKFHVLNLVTSFAEQERGKGEHNSDCINLFLAVQPVLEESKGTWKEIESFLVRLLQKDLDQFGDLCLKLAERSAEIWLKVLREPRSFEWLLSEMTGKDVGNMVGRMLLSADVDRHAICPPNRRPRLTQPAIT